MSTTTEDLIAQLAARAGPVRRLAPPMTRALAWLAVIAVLGAGVVWKLGNLPAFAHRASDPRLALELAATLATGVAGVVAAFHLCVPDRSRAWAWLPLPFAVLWLALSGLGCWRYWAEQAANGWRLGESAACFVFLLAAGVPLGALLILPLRRARPLQPRLVSAVAAAGTAGLAAFLLQFCHPFDVTLLDLGSHLAALTILVLILTLPSRRTLAGRPRRPL